MPEQPNPEGYIGSTATSKLSDLEVEVARNAAFVHTSALVFARIAFEEIRGRNPGDPHIKEDSLATLSFLSKAAALSHAVHVFLLDPNTVKHLEIVRDELEEIYRADLSDVFEDKIGEFAERLSDLSMQRRVTKQAQRLSRN